MIDISLFLIIKAPQLDAILATLGLQLPVDQYFIGLILTNIFAYFLIILFFVLGLYVIRKIKRKIRRIFT